MHGGGLQRGPDPCFQESVNFVHVAVVSCLSRSIQIFLQVSPCVSSNSNFDTGPKDLKRKVPAEPHPASGSSNCIAPSTSTVPHAISKGTNAAVHALSLSHAVQPAEGPDTNTRVQVRKEILYLLGPCF